MGHVSDRQNQVAFFRGQSTLILRHELSCRSVTTIFSPIDNTLTLIPFGSAKVYVYTNHKLGASSAVTDTVLFPKLSNKKISRVSFFPGQKIVIHFDGKCEAKYEFNVLLKCIKCDKIIDIHMKSGSVLILPYCNCRNDN